MTADRMVCVVAIVAGVIAFATDRTIDRVAFAEALLTYFSLLGLIAGVVAVGHELLMLNGSTTRKDCK